MSAHPTSDNASGLWPTPAAQNPGFKNVEVVDKDGNPPAHFHQRFYNKQTGQIMQRGLEQAVQWLTPRVLEVEESQENFARRMNGKRKNDRKNGYPNLTSQVKAKEQAVHWPTPLAQEAKHGTVTDWEMETDHTGTKESLWVKVAKAEQTQWPTPTVCGNYNRKGASKTSGDGLATAVWKKGGANGKTAITITGSLNPNWVEWLMGYPTGWTVLEDLETPSYRRSPTGWAHG